MARTFAPNATHLNATGKLNIGNAQLARTGTKKVISVITMAAQASADDIVLGEVKPGDRFLGATVNVSATTGTATVALGIEGSTAKYAAAVAYTTADTPTPKGKATAIGVAETASKLILATIGTEALPGAGTLTVVMEFATADVG